MNKRPKLTPRQTLIAIACLTAVIAGVLLIHTLCNDQSTFDRLSRELFTKQLTASTIDLHYTLAYPEQHGIDSYTPTLPLYDSAGEAEQLLQLENTLNTLNSINETNLRETDAYLLKLLKKSLSLSLELGEYPYFREPLSPSGGMHVQLPLLLSEYTFRSIRDIEDYLSLLGQTDQYFASLLIYEQEKKQAGRFMPSASLEKVITQCDTIITREEILSGTHFLQLCFVERLQQLAAKLNATAPGTLDARQIDTYIKKHNDLLKNVVLPAYESLADGLFLLQESNKPLTGLAASEGGAEYYRLLLNSQTGSCRKPEDIKTLYIQQLQQEYDQLCALVAESTDLVNALQRGAYHDLSFESTEDMLSDLRRRIDKDFPSYLFAGFSEPEVIVKDVHPSLSPYSAPAFYLTVPLDDSDTNVIYLNNSSSYTDLELYTTLAHEGFPGHLYQTVFHNRSFTAKEENSLRQLLWYGGYLEGWALYVEFIAYDYVSEMLREEHRLADAACVEMEKHNRSMQLCLYSLLDYVIHYENALPEDIRPLLEPFGVTDAADILAVYEYIVEDPCNYPKYYLGYLEICNLQQLAREKWGTTYTDYRFHTFMLEQGPSDFDSLQKALTE